jgi:tripartite-type tricarboxylate transporter receptor subunit TctC
MKGETMSATMRPWHPARRFFIAALAALGLHAGAAQAWPEKPVRMLVAVPPGSAVDTTARFVARNLQQALGQPFLVENRPGGNSIIAAKAVAESAPDGYTLFVASNSPLVTNVAVFRELPYDAVRDFAPIAGIARFPMVLVVPASSPYRTMQQLVAGLRAADGKMNYAAGTPTYQVTVELFHERNGVRGTPVPYKGTAPAIADVAAGSVAYSIAEVSAVLPLVRAGKLRALAVAAGERLKTLPDVPTFAENGNKDFEAYAWTGVFAPGRVSPAIVQRVADAMRASMTSAEGVAFVESIGGIPFNVTPQQFREFQLAEIEMTKRMVRNANITIE